MRRIKTVSVLVAAATLAMVGFGSTAYAAAGDTATTFSLTGGSISISVPATATLGSTTTGSASLANQSLGNVTVTDLRGNLVAQWTATVSSTDFTTGGGTADERVVKGNVAYSSGAGTAAAGQVGAFVPVVGTALSAPATAGTWAGVGNNTVTWAPTVTFTLIPSQVTGTYSGTINHSVA
jgi:hypothetical protein